MTDSTVLKIALAGLLHDVGKFAQGCNFCNSLILPIFSNNSGKES